MALSSCCSFRNLELLSVLPVFFIFLRVDILYLKVYCYHLLSLFFFLSSYVEKLTLTIILLLATLKEWSEGTYPPWAHGPGYVVSHDIARTVSKKFRENHLKVYNKIHYLLKTVCIVAIVLNVFCANTMLTSLNTLRVCIGIQLANWTPKQPPLLLHFYMGNWKTFVQHGWNGFPNTPSMIQC